MRWTLVMVILMMSFSETSGLQSGSPWQAELKKASHRCEAVIVLISRAWNDSIWCRTEFLLAKQLGKKMFGVLIDDIPIAELPHELTSEFQLCDLVNGDARVAFDVEREPFVPPSRVDLPEVGLTALKRGLQSAGLEATTFPWPPEDELKRAPYRGLKPYEAQDAAIFFGVHQHLLSPRAGAVDVDGGPDSSVDQLAVQADFEVARPLELLEDDLVHPAARIDQCGGDDR